MILVRDLGFANYETRDVDGSSTILFDRHSGLDWRRRLGYRHRSQNACLVGSDLGSTRVERLPHRREPEPASFLGRLVVDYAQET